MSKTLRVLAPYVTLKVTDQVRGTVLVGYYEGAIVENVDDDSADHHIESGLAEKVSKDAEPAAPPFMPQGLPPGPGASYDEPAGNANREEWANFARSQRGATDADLLDADGKELGRNELRDKYSTPAE